MYDEKLYIWWMAFFCFLDANICVYMNHFDWFIPAGLSIMLLSVIDLEDNYD